MMKGLEGHSFCPPFCSSCTAGKAARKPSREPGSAVTTYLERVHMDLMGPTTPSVRSNTYMLTITDQYSGRVWVFFRKTKQRIVEQIKIWIRDVEFESRRYLQGQRVQSIRFDRGREFLNKAMTDFCANRGTQLEPTVGYHPEGNGVAERCNRTIMHRALAIRVAVGLPEEYWEFAAETVVYLRNRGVVKKMTESPWEQWTGKKPNSAHLRVWGCPVYVLIPKEKRTKQEPRTWEGIFVGYKEDTDKVYKVWSLTEKKVYEVRFLVFDETKTGVRKQQVDSLEAAEELELGDQPLEREVSGPTIH